MQWIEYFTERVDERLRPLPEQLELTPQTGAVNRSELRLGLLDDAGNVAYEIFIQLRHA